MPQGFTLQGYASQIMSAKKIMELSFESSWITVRIKSLEELKNFFLY